MANTASPSSASASNQSSGAEALFRPLTMMVCSNSVFGWNKAGQRSGFDERYYSVDFDRTAHAAVAEAFGVKSWRVEDPAQLRGPLAAAVEHDGPTLVDVLTQPLDEARAPVSEWAA
jgi:acetolactate synthase-1/2/3 large subunit